MNNMKYLHRKDNCSSILEEWLTPLSMNDFFCNFWEKKPLVLKGRYSNCFSDILSLKDVDFLLSSLNSSVGFYKNVKWVRFINNKKELKIDNYLRNESDFLNMDKVLAGFKGGNTIVLNRLQHRWFPIWKVCHELEKILGHFVSANMYLSPENAQGFDAHYDPHDVFILQLEGEKLWKIYPDHVEFPIGTKDSPFTSPLSPPLYELYLTPGDLLYIPRGWVHVASTAKKYSLHLTIGIHVLTWLDLISELSVTEPSFRRSIPQELLCGEKNVDIDLESLFQKLAYLFANKEVIKVSIQNLRKKLIEKKTPPLMGYLTSFSEAEKFSENTRINKKGEEWKIDRSEDKLTVHFNGIKVNLPIVLEPLIEYISREGEFFINQLPFPIQLEEKIEVVRTLVKSGLLIVIP